MKWLLLLGLAAFGLLHGSPAGVSPQFAPWWYWAVFYTAWMVLALLVLIDDAEDVPADLDLDSVAAPSGPAEKGGPR